MRHFPGERDDFSGYVCPSLSNSRGEGHASLQASLSSLKLLPNSDMPLDLIITYCIMMDIEKCTAVSS